MYKQLMLEGWMPTWYQPLLGGRSTAFHAVDKEAAPHWSHPYTARMSGVAQASAVQLGSLQAARHQLGPNNGSISIK